MTTGRCTCIMKYYLYCKLCEYNLFILRSMFLLIVVKVNKNSTDNSLSMFSCFQCVFPIQLYNQCIYQFFCNVLLVLICIVCFIVVSCTLYFILNFPTYAPEFIYFRHYSYITSALR